MMTGPLRGQAVGAVHHRAVDQPDQRGEHPAHEKLHESETLAARRGFLNRPNGYRRADAQPLPPAPDPAAPRSRSSSTGCAGSRPTFSTSCAGACSTAACRRHADPARRGRGGVRGEPDPGPGGAEDADRRGAGRAPAQRRLHGREADRCRAARAVPGARGAGDRGADGGGRPGGDRDDHAGARRRTRRSTRRSRAGDVRGYHRESRRFHFALVAAVRDAPAAGHVGVRLEHHRAGAADGPPVRRRDRAALHRDHGEMLAAFVDRDAATLLPWRGAAPRAAGELDRHVPEHTGLFRTI